MPVCWGSTAHQPTQGPLPSQSCHSLGVSWGWGLESLLWVGCRASSGRSRCISLQEVHVLLNVHGDVFTYTFDPKSHHQIISHRVFLCPHQSPVFQCISGRELLFCIHNLQACTHSLIGRKSFLQSAPSPPCCSLGLLSLFCGNR